AHMIDFKKLTEDDLNLLHKWFHIPHVFKWYAKEPYTLAMIQKKYLPRINDFTIQSYIIFDNEIPVGYIQIYQIDSHLPEGVTNYQHQLFNDFKKNELAGIDFFIADKNYLHKGFASKALQTFIDHCVRDKYKAILVDPLKQNKIAVSFFEKNNFQYLASDDTE